MESGGTPERWRVLAATFLSYLYDSFDLVILAISMPVLIRVLHITMAQGGLLASVTMVGAAIGSIVIGMIAENRGRKFALVLSLCAFGIGDLFVFLIGSWGQWMVLRLVNGMAIGGVWGPCVALISKHWAPRYRARAGASMLSTFAIGAIAASLVGRLVLSYDWRLLFLVGSTAMLAAACVWWAVPDDNPKKVSGAVQAGKAEVKEKERVGLSDIFHGDVGRRTVLATILNAFSMGGYWGAATWIPSFLTRERGLSLGTMANFSLVIYVGMFIGYQFFGYLGDQIGRKRSIMWSSITCAVAIPIYIVIANGLVMFWWGTVVGFGFGGVFGVMGAYFAELFPENIRALAGGFCFNVGRIGAVIAPFTVGVLGQMYGLRVGLTVASSTFVLGLAILVLLPETAMISCKAPDDACLRDASKSSCSSS